MDREIRLGIVGYGNMGTSHSKWITGGLIPNLKLTCICDISEVRRAEAKKILPSDVSIFDDYDSMLESGNMDAVLVAVPHYLHPGMAIKAMKKGYHVLVEKPAGVYAKQIREMNEEAEKHPELIFGMMFNQRTNPLYKKVKEIMDSGKLGSLRRVTWIITSWYRTQKYYDSSSWRATWSGEGGGVLVNQAPHNLDLLQYLTGMPVSMRAYLKYGSHRKIDVEDDVTAYFEYPNGASGVLITCTHDPIGTDLLEIHGDNGKIIVEGNSKLTVKILNKSENELNETMGFREMNALLKGEGTEPLCSVETYEMPEKWDIQHIDILKNFTNTILGKETLIAPGSDGIKAVQIANSMHLSSWLDKDVSLPVDEDLFYSELKKRIDKELKKNE